MEKRTVSAVIGDWSDDGHGKTKTVLYLLEGDDLSNDALNNSYKKMVREIGDSIFNYCQGYEEDTIPGEFYDRLVEFGLTNDNKGYDYNDQHISFNVGSYSDYKEFPLSKILEIYLQVKITPIPMPVLLFGGYSTILNNNSFGYGLFY